jgi:hypothetical protein
MSIEPKSTKLQVSVDIAPCSEQEGFFRATAMLSRDLYVLRGPEAYGEGEDRAVAFALKALSNFVLQSVPRTNFKAKERCIVSSELASVLDVLVYR